MPRPGPALRQWEAGSPARPRPSRGRPGAAVWRSACRGAWGRGRRLAGGAAGDARTVTGRRPGPRRLTSARALTRTPAQPQMTREGPAASRSGSPAARHGSRGAPRSQKCPGVLPGARHARPEPPPPSRGLGARRTPRDGTCSQERPAAESPWPLAPERRSAGVHVWKSTGGRRAGDVRLPLGGASLNSILPL